MKIQDKILYQKKMSFGPLLSHIHFHYALENIFSKHSKSSFECLITRGPLQKIRVGEAFWWRANSKERSLLFLIASIFHDLGHRETLADAFFNNSEMISLRSSADVLLRASRASLVSYATETSLSGLKLWFPVLSWLPECVTDPLLKDSRNTPRVPIYFYKAASRGPEGAFKGPPSPFRRLIQAHGGYVSSGGGTASFLLVFQSIKKKLIIIPVWYLSPGCSFPSLSNKCELRRPQIDT